MTSCGPGKLMGSKSVPWVGNREFKIYITHRMFPIWHIRQWRKLGNQVFQCMLVQANKIMQWFQFIQNFTGGHFGRPNPARGPYV